MASVIGEWEGLPGKLSLAMPCTLIGGAANVTRVVLSGG